MIHPDIKKAIELIDQRIESLKKIRESLAKEFGMEEMVTHSAEPKDDRQQQFLLSDGTGKKKTRHEQVREFLQSAGPTRRKMIAMRLGIPAGTVAFVLNDKTTFVNVGDGRWTLVEENTVL